MGDAIAQHRTYLESSGDWARRERTRLGAELENLLRETLVTRWREQISDGQYQAVLESVFSRELGPFEAVKKLLDNECLTSSNTIMLNICEKCGIYRADKTIDPSGPFAICPACGHRHDFRYAPAMDHFWGQWKRQIDHVQPFDWSISAIDFP